MTDRPHPAAKPGRLRRLRRRLSGALALAVTLGLVGVGYAAVASAAGPGARASAPAPESVDVRKGRQLFEQGCISCHGQNLQGVEDRGPSLIGVGQAAAYFQLATGRMPATQQEAQVEPKRPRYNEAEIEQIAAYIQSVGGGPVIPEGELTDGDLAEGGELFRLNCASCHNYAARGGALSAGKYAPSINASPEVIYAAMLSGPQNMPVFGDNQITPEQKRSIIKYLESLQESKDPGGSGLGRLGPVPEGLVIWVVGIGALMLTILWIGAKS
jgi:ubiquinol-cytochrome c reductase cytochrome c subunit